MHHDAASPTPTGAPPAHRPPPATLVLRLAAQAGADPRTARKAIMLGPRAIRGMAGERLATAMAELGIPDPSEVQGR